MSRPSAAVQRHWNRLAAMGCLICQGPAEIAHAHGASIVTHMQEPKAKGKKLARYHWLVLPLCPVHGREGNGGASLDDNPTAWEARYGTQADWIDVLCVRTGLDLWALANEGRK